MRERVRLEMRKAPEGRKTRRVQTSDGHRVNRDVRQGHTWFVQCLGVIQEMSPLFKIYLLENF